MNDDRLDLVSELMDQTHKEHMDALWEGQEERAERAYRQYQRLLKDYQSGKIYEPKF
jgi:hypothetical protein